MFRLLYPTSSDRLRARATRAAHCMPTRLLVQFHPTALEILHSIGLALDGFFHCRCDRVAETFQAAITIPIA
jgi:hypothetical protein